MNKINFKRQGSIFARQRDQCWVLCSTAIHAFRDALFRKVIDNVIMLLNLSHQNGIAFVNVK